MTSRDSPGTTWLAAADILAVLLLVLTLQVIVFGGFRTSLAGAIVTVHSSARLAVLAATVIIVRHALRRRPSILTRIASAVRRLTTAESVRAVAPCFVWSRLAILAVGYFSIVTFGYPEQVTFRVSRNEFLNMPARWDAGWYLQIAQDGYRYDPQLPKQQNLVFFPAFPLVTRVAGLFAGANADRGIARFTNPVRLLWAGVLVNLAAFALALGYVYWMVRAFANVSVAQAALQFVVAYPMAFIFNAAYTEGLFLLASAATFYHFGRAQHRRAFIWGLTAGLTRPNGFLLSVPLLVIALTCSGPLRRFGHIVDRLNWLNSNGRSPARDIATALAPVVGLLIFSVFLFVDWGDPFLWAKLQGAWGRTYVGMEAVEQSVDALARVGVYGYTHAAGYEVLNILVFLFALSVSVPIAWRLGLAYSVLILMTVLPPLLAGGWLSMARLTVVLFPIYVYLAIAVPTSHRIPLLMAFSAVQGLGASLFFTWRPFY